MYNNYATEFLEDYHYNEDKDKDEKWEHYSLKWFG